MNDRLSIFFLLLFFAAGCRPHQRAAMTTRPATQAMTAPDDAQASLSNEASASSGLSPEDPKTPLKRLVQLDVYVMTLPAGAVSRNPEFWKRIDENGVDPRQHDTLDYNGVRVGEARVADWPYFKELFDPYPVETRQNRIIGVVAKSQEILMRSAVNLEHIWCFSLDGTLSGRTYEQCDNIWDLSYQPTPRKGDFVQVSLCPMVRTLRKHLELIKHPRPGEPQEREYAYVHPEQLLDLSVTIDLPPGKFLVLAPSPKVDDCSVGQAFLMTSSRGIREERVILFVPTLINARESTQWLRPRLEAPVPPVK